MIFVIPKSSNYFDSLIPNLSVATVLEALNLPHIEVIDLNNVSFSEAVEIIIKDPDKVILMTCMVDNYMNGLKFISDVKKVANKIIAVVGGPHVTLLSQSVNYKFPEILDIICCGYVEDIGELLMLNIKDLKDNKSSQNNVPIILKSSKNTTRMIKPNWDNVYNYTQSIPIFMIEGSRGCPFHCKFCSHSDIAGSTTIYKPLVNFVEEIVYNYSKYKITHYRFTDSQISFPTRRFRELLEKLIYLKKHTISELTWVGFARLVDLNEDLVEPLLNSGCVGLFIGLENPKQEKLREFNKAYNFKQAKKIINLVNQGGIHTFGNYIFGLPGDTKNDWQLFVDHAISLRIKSVNVNPFYLAPNSIYANDKEKYGITLLNSNWIDEFHNIFITNKTYFRTTDMKQEDMKEGVQLIKDELIKCNVIWNMKDYQFLALKALGVNLYNLIRIWNKLAEYLPNNHEIIDEIKRGGRFSKIANSSLEYKQYLDDAIEKINNLDWPYLK